MAQITRLQSAALARALGLREALGPSELADLVIPVLSIEPYLFSADSPEISTTVPASFVPLGSGHIVVLPIANPAAGAEFNIVVPRGVAWQVITFFTRFIASATVATRRIRLDLLDNVAARLMLVPTLTVVNASEGWDITWGAGINSRVAAGGDKISSTDIPNYLILGPGFTLRTVTAAMAAGDTYTEGRLLLREYGLG